MENIVIDALAFAPHPDDAEMGCGGLLALLKDEGYKTGIIDLTRGELSSNGDLITREHESENAKHILGLDVRENLAIKDGNIENNKENKDKIIVLLRKYKPKLVLYPYPQDRHPDHENTSKLLKEAIFLSGLVKYETEFAAYRPNIIVNYMLHFEFNPSFVVDISRYFDVKVSAVKSYKSQFFSDNENQIATHISSKAFKEILFTRARYFGLKIDCEYGEPFFINSKIKINDPIKFFDYVIY